MRFAEPDYLWLLLLLPLIGIAGWWSLSRKLKALSRFAGGREFIERFRDDVCGNRRATKLILIQLALLCAILAAARPQWGIRMEEVSSQGADLVVVLDTSLSMAAADIAPNRLELARQSIDTLLDYLTGDRVALVTFAGRATLSCPLTLDHGAVRLFLDAVGIEEGPVSGTSLADALAVAVRAFGDGEQSATPSSKAILVFTDGEDHEGELEEMLESLSRSGIAVYAVGTGSPRGAPIPLANGGYKKDREGKVVTTRLDEIVLQQLALETGGQYHRATAGQAEMQEVARTLSGLDSRDFGAVLRARYEERFQVPLALALLALLAETLFGDRRRRPRSVAVRETEEAQ